MQALRKFVLLLVMVYFLFLVLVITNLVSVDFLDREFTHFNPLNFFKILVLLGAVLLALVLAVEQSHAALLRRQYVQAESTVQQLKASLYDHKQQAARAPEGARPVPPVAPAPDPSAPTRPVGPADTL